VVDAEPATREGTKVSGPMEQRLADGAAGDAAFAGSRFTDVEAHLGTRYTAQTLAALRCAYPGVRFVWLMGAG